MVPWLGPEDPFPLVETALRGPNGLLAAGAGLSPPRLLDAYRHGIFPWYSEEGPILWWSPDPRMVLVPSDLIISRSLQKTLKKQIFETKCDTVFVEVMRACAQPRDDRRDTWINPDIIAAYSELHYLGWAHSVETWHNGELVGGLYGVAIGKVFFGESMFTRATDASKVALARLVDELILRQFSLIDCQMSTQHLASLGAREIPRTEFTRRLKELVNYETTTGLWNHGPA